jgi:hypothetical protein
MRIGQSIAIRLNCGLHASAMPRSGFISSNIDYSRGRPSAAKGFKAHLDDYNQLPYLTGRQPKSAREEFAYFNDDGVLVAYRLAVILH